MTIDPVSLAITAALTAAQMGLAATQKIEGPRLDDLSVTVADYGTPLNYFYGVRRFEGVPIIFAEPLREVKKKRKTKGGKYNEYTYFGTWAVALAGHQIDGVKRIWFDKHLVYDATGAGPISPFVLGKKFIIQDHIRFYLGTEDQMPDPRMLATVEAEHGAGSCPAYRGIAYIFFEEMPLEKLGNRIPQITVEAVAHGATAYPWETFDYALEKPGNLALDPSGNFAMWGTGNYEVWDLPSRTLMGSGAYPAEVSTGRKGISSAGIVYAAKDGSEGLPGGGLIQSFDATSGAFIGSLETGGPYQDGCVVLAAGDGAEYLLTFGWSFFATQYMLKLTEDLTGFSPGWQELAFGWKITQYFTDSHGDIWAVGTVWGPFVGSTTLYMQRVVDSGARPGSASSATFTSMPSPGSGVQVDGCHYDGHFILQWNGSYLILVDDETMSIVDSRSFGYGFAANNWTYHDPAQPTLWLGTTELSLTDLSTVRTINLLDWKNEDAAFGSLSYIPSLNAILASPQFEAVITFRYLDRIDSDGVALGSIADDVAERCGLPAGGYNFSALDQVVTGYNWSQGSGRDILDPLFSAYDSDITPHDFTIRGVKRGGASSGTIDVAQFVRDPDRYKVSITQDADLPRALTFSFADTGAEQQTNSVLVQRPSVAIDGVRELSINMTSLALSVDDARGLAERYFRRLWAGRERIENTVTAQYLALEPTDVKLLGLDGINRTGRALETTLTADGRIKALWERDDPSIALLSGAAGAAMDGREPSVMLVPVPTRGFVLDVPLSRDVDDQTTPFMIVAAGSYSASGYWSGAEFYVSDDGAVDSYEAGWASIGPLDACTWGFATDTLGDALPWLPDNANSLNVDLRGGELESVSDAEFDASSTLNLALVQSGVGWEYIRFRTATLEGDGSWTISGLARGLRGTEQWIAGHGAGDRFLLVDASLAKKAMGASEIGDTDYYKAVSQGRDEEATFAESVSFSAAAQKPYSPVHGALTLDSGSGDWSIDATRRTRIGGGNIDGSDVPLGETAESWSCDIMDGADVVRTITGSSLPLTYASAAQTADFGAPQTSLTVNLYQVSPALSLRGYGLEIAA